MKKKNMKRYFLLMVFMGLYMMSMHVSAMIGFEEKFDGFPNGPLASGVLDSQDGGEITWACGNGQNGYRTLVISGKGKMVDYTTESCIQNNYMPETPWNMDTEYGMLNSGFAFVEEGITYLGECTFARMGSVMYISLPETLTEIGGGAFAGCCNLIEINIPKSVKKIGDGAFNTAIGGLTIRCEKDSYAYRYAQEMGINVYLTDISECEQYGHKALGSATCTSPQMCRVCGAQMKAALGHDFGAAACETPQRCSRCPEEKGQPLGHDWGSWNSWYYGKERRVCTRCSDYETRTIKKVSSVVVKGAPKTLLSGKTVNLSAVVSPSDAANKEIKWSSSNTKYASVSQDGVVKVKAAGAGKTVTITASATDGSGEKGTCKIKVKGAVKKIKLKVAKKTVKAGKKVKITAAVTVGKGGSKALKWTSSNKKYATVSSKGVVTAKKAGKGKKVTITATAKDGSGKKASVAIKIK